MKAYVSKCIALVSLICLSACSLTHSKYESELKPSNSAFAHSQYFKGGNIQKDFYKSFQDKHLNNIIDKALTYNYSLNEAYINVQLAYKQLGLTQSDQYPDLNASMSTNASRALDINDKSKKSSSLQITTSYSIDLFGKLSAATKGDYFNYEASAYDYLAMRQSLIASTAYAYYQYVYSYEDLLLGFLDLVEAKRRLNIVKVKYEAGQVDALEYDVAYVNYLTVEQSLYQRLNSFETSKSALCILIGQDVADFIAIGTLDKVRVPKFSLVLKAQLLQRRPDLQASEARVKQALALKDEANLSFFPQINLQASLGTSSGVLFSQFLQNPIGSLGAAITLPFINYYELKLQQDMSLLELDKAKLKFVNDYLTAVADVYDKISSFMYQKQMLKSTYLEYKLTKQNYIRYKQRYILGKSSLSDLLDASVQLNSAERKLLQAKRDVLVSSINLMVAQGGDNDEQSFNDLQKQVSK